jgi:hypothetical protein
MKNAVFLDVTPRKNRSFRGMYRLYHQDDKNRRALRRMLRLLVALNAVPSSLILVTFIMEAISSSETSVLTRATRRSIKEDCILYSHRRENLKSYIALTGWVR